MIETQTRDTHLSFVVTSGIRKHGTVDMVDGCSRGFDHDVRTRRAEYLHENRNVQSDGEDIGAEAIHDPGEHLVPQLSAEMLEIQSRVQDTVQRTGINEAKAGGRMLQRLHADQHRRSLHSCLLQGLCLRHLHRSRRLQVRVWLRRTVMRFQMSTWKVGQIL